MGLEMGLTFFLPKHRHRSPNAYPTASPKKTDRPRCSALPIFGEASPPPQMACIDGALAVTTPPLVAHCKQIGCVSIFIPPLGRY